MSWNVVGYSSATLRAGNKGAGACFIPVSGSKTIDLNDIKVVGYVDGCEGDVYVQQLDRYGRAQEAFTWYDLPEDEICGWFDGSDEPVEVGAVTLAIGDALWVNAPDADYGIQSAGQVPTSDVATALRAGNKLVSNPTPVDVDLVNVVVSGYEDGCEGDVYVQQLDRYGRAQEAFTWYDLPEDDIYGWFNGSDEPVEEGAIVLAPGESLWVNAISTDYSIVFPGVAIK